MELLKNYQSGCKGVRTLVVGGGQGRRVVGERERRWWLRELEAECHSEEGWAPMGRGTP